jgi:hypothetical protein
MQVARCGLLVGSLALFWTGCATHVPDHVAADESRPHISWELRSGNDGDEEFICGSEEPAKPCVLAASTEKNRVLATVRLFAHPAAHPTSYLGFFRAPFIQRETDLRLGEINTTVEPEARPVGATVVGQVTSNPAASTLSISVDATQFGALNPLRFRQDVPVIVK